MTAVKTVEKDGNVYEFYDKTITTFLEEDGNTKKVVYRIQFDDASDCKVNVFLENTVQVNGEDVPYVPTIGDEIRIGRKVGKGKKPDFYWFVGLAEAEREKDKKAEAKDDYWAAKLEFDINVLHPARSLQEYVKIAASLLTPTDNKDEFESNVELVFNAGKRMYDLAQSGDNNTE